MTGRIEEKNRDCRIQGPARATKNNVMSITEPSPMREEQRASIRINRKQTNGDGDRGEAEEGADARRNRRRRRSRGREERRSGKTGDAIGTE